MQNYKSSGVKLPLTAPSGGVVAGMGYQIGDLFVVAESDAEETETFVGLTAGVISGLPKATGQTWDEGELLFWDDTPVTGKKVTSDDGSGSNLPIGHAAASAILAATTGDVLLRPIMALAVGES